MGLTNRTVFFGGGSCLKDAFVDLRQNFENPIVIDNDQSKEGTRIDEFEIHSPQILRELDFNQIIITSSFIHEIQQQLVKEYHIDPQKINIYNYNKKAVEKWIPEPYSKGFHSNKNFSNLIENLPKITRIKIECGEIDLYGVRHTIAEKAGLKSTPKTKTRWYHGWNALPLNDPKLLITCGNFSELKNFTYLTNTQPEADLLSRNGFKNATAVGSNFLYAKPHSLPSRIPKSVLVVPTHTTSRCSDSFNISQNVENIINQIEHSPEIMACCVGGNDALSLDNNIFSNLTFPSVTGAWTLDKNALIRMWMIFSAFETIITDAIGSHIAYALACGTKVKIVESKNKINKDAILANEPYYKTNPDLLDFALKENTIARVRKNFPEIFSATTEKERINIGQKLLGNCNVKNINIIHSLLGWD